MEVKIIFLLQDQLIPPESGLKRRSPSKSHKIFVPHLSDLFISDKAALSNRTIRNGSFKRGTSLLLQSTHSHGVQLKRLLREASRLRNFNPRTHKECDSENVVIHIPNDINFLLYRKN
ncbi:hypothetical protein WGM54_18755 [Paenibacillus polymyxa]|uniref:hypothetical protein n=1 Tax=Paenibacillus polymyxa TaxID=1406 RepID=UPI00307E3020